MAAENVEHLYDGRKLSELPSSPKEAKAQGLDFYYTGRACKHGHTSVRRAKGASCLACQAVRMAEWRSANPEKAKALQARTDKSEASRSSHKRWRERNSSRLSAYSKKWNMDNPERRRAHHRKSADKNRDKLRLRARLYRQNNPEICATAARNKRARRKGAEGSHTAEDIRRIRKQQRDRCAMPWCRKKLHGKGHKDHIIPLSEGGTNWPWNVQLTCDTCNLRKHAKDPIDFVQENGYLI